MRRGLLALSFLLVLLVPAGPAWASLPGDPPPPPLQGLTVGDPPPVSAGVWLVYDDTLEFELAGLAEDKPVPMASTTKMMTALVALENADLDEIVLVSRRAAAVGESEVGLHPGEALPMEDLITVMLVRSANDAAVAIAEHVGGSLGGFVDMMNDRGAEMGLESTNFQNPHGLDAPGHHSSARDLLRIAIAGMEWPAFAVAVATPEFSLPDAPDGTSRVAKTTNGLLRDEFEGILGVKTGFTNDAGLTFVAAAEREGRTLYVVVLGSVGRSSHFNDAGALLEWGFSEFRLVELFVEGTTYGQYRGSEGTEPLVAEQSSQILLTRTARRTDVSFEPRFEEESPVMVATLEDAELARIPLSVGSPRDMPSLSDALGWIEHYWHWLWNG